MGLSFHVGFTCVWDFCEPQARDQRIRRSFVERGSASYYGVDLIVSWSSRKKALMLLKIAYSVSVSNLFFTNVSILSVEFLVLSFYFMTMMKRRRRRKKNK